MGDTNRSFDKRVYAIVLAGGTGTRLWPLSRTLLPKQLLNLNGRETLLQQTAQRLMGQVSPEHIYTVTNENHRFEVRSQLHAIDPKLADAILVEPESRNTLPAIAWAVAQIAHQNPEALVGVFPSDHAIQDLKAFQEDFSQALQIAAQGHLVTFGIKPTGPETGYGYIKVGTPLDHSRAYTVEAFVEKPDREKAVHYLETGKYYWNAGMFAFQAASFQENLDRLEPTISKSILKIVSDPKNTHTLKEEFLGMKNISIDYGIIEKAKNVAVVPSHFEWNDLGNWESLHEHMEKDHNQNVIQGDVMAMDTHSSLLISKKGLIAAIGLKDAVVVQTDDAVLVSSRDRVQDVKNIVDQLKARGSTLTESHSTVYRPWGFYTNLEDGPGYKIKRIVVNPKQKLSLQRHKNRAEHWVVIKGVAKITNGDNEFTLKSNESTFIPQGEKHRLENPQETPLIIIEVQTGSYLGEDDIERFEDVYGRSNKLKSL